MPIIKIYKYMKELDLKKEFFIQLFWRLAAAVLGIGAAFYLKRFDMIAVILLAFLFCFLHKCYLFCIQYQSVVHGNSAFPLCMKNFLFDDVSYSQNFLTVTLAFILSLINSVNSFSSCIVFLFFTICEWSVFRFSLVSKYHWLCFHPQIDTNIKSFMSTLGLEDKYFFQSYIRMFFSVFAFVIAAFLSAPLFGLSCIRFSSYSIIYHFSKNKYQYQNTFNPRTSLQKILFYFRWAFAFSSVLIVLFFPFLWSLPLVVIRILEPLEQKIFLSS